MSRAFPAGAADSVGGQDDKDGDDEVRHDGGADVHSVHRRSSAEGSAVGHPALLCLGVVVDRPGGHARVVVCGVVECLADQGLR